MKEKRNKSKLVEPPRVILENDAWVRRLARSLVFDQSQADDVVQQTWLELFRRPPAQEGNLRGWLNVVVKNVARKIKRSDRNRQKRERRTAKEELIEPQVAGKHDRETLRSRILRAVEELEEPYRSTIKLRFLEEQNPMDIAKQMGTPLDTVYTRLRRGMVQLRAKLDKQYGDRSLWTSVVISWKGSGKLWGTGAIAAGFAVLAIPATLLLVGLPASSPSEERVATQSAVTTPALASSSEDRRETIDTLSTEASPKENSSQDKTAIHEDSREVSQGSGEGSIEEIPNTPAGKGLPRRIQLDENGTVPPSEKTPPNQTVQTAKNLNHSSKTFKTNKGNGKPNKP